MGEAGMPQSDARCSEYYLDWKLKHEKRHEPQHIREKGFHRVISRVGKKIELDLRVVNSMKNPHNMDFVQYSMYPIFDQVHEYDGQEGSLRPKHVAETSKGQKGEVALVDVCYAYKRRRAKYDVEYYADSCPQAILVESG